MLNSKLHHLLGKTAFIVCMEVTFFLISNSHHIIKFV